MTQAVNIIQTFKCGTVVTIPPNRIISLDATGLAVLSTGVLPNSIGVSTEVGSDFGLAMDVTVGGIAYLAIAVAAGLSVAAGTLLTSDGNGLGIAAATGNRVVAILLENAAANGQICKVVVCQSVI